MKICDQHTIEVPLLFTFKFPGTEYWCPVCERTWDIFGSGRDVDGTAALDLRHHLLEQMAHDYLSNMVDEWSGITEDHILEVELKHKSEDIDHPQIECNGCGLKQSARIGPRGEIIKPSYWYEREDEDGKQTACSRDCIDTIAKKSGKTRVVMPW